ncbi:hypothetical protein ABH927_006774 [Planotetraspora sp. GP83]
MAFMLCLFLILTSPKPRSITDEQELLRAALARVIRFAHDMRDWCSPHGVAAQYADRLAEAIYVADVLHVPVEHIQALYGDEVFVQYDLDGKVMRLGGRPPTRDQLARRIVAEPDAQDLIGQEGQTGDGHA